MCIRDSLDGSHLFGDVLARALYQPLAQVGGELRPGIGGDVDAAPPVSYTHLYREAPKSYIRKLTLAPEVEAFQLMKKGESVLLTWEIMESGADDF